MARDYYSTLGIARTASQEEIKKAYRRLAHEHHPDKGGDEKKFKEINEAYSVLGDLEKRQQYDQFGRVFSSGGASPDGRGDGFPGFDFNFGGGGIRFEDLPEQFGDAFQDFFGFPGGSSRRRGRFRGKDVAVEISLNLEQAYSGISTAVELEKFVVCGHCGGSGGVKDGKFVSCPMCKGKGQVEEVTQSILGSFTRSSRCPHCKGKREVPEQACRECRGEGRVRSRVSIPVSIPPGILDGIELRIAQGGEAGEKGGEAGDLFVRVQVAPHPVFKRRNDDLFSSVEIPFSTVTLGGTIDVKTIEGSVKLKIPAQTPSGNTFRLRGKGMPHLGAGGSGDAYVTVHVRVPKNLSKKAKEFLEKLKEEGL